VSYTASTNLGTSETSTITITVGAPADPTVTPDTGSAPYAHLGGAPADPTVTPDTESAPYAYLDGELPSTGSDLALPLGLGALLLVLGAALLGLARRRSV
ncbi:MAG: LPXTG cell wall anchor domain-containing protein, partial [Nocardioidaceae bacterium]